jgi:hypothetical protein
VSAPKGFLALLIAAAAPASSGADPRVDYMLECQGCHLSDGAGFEDGVPALQGQVARFLHVPGGREYLIRVPGSAQSPLGDAELAAVLNWMMRRFGPSDAAASFEPFSAAEVSRHRARPLVDVEPVRRDLLRRIEAARARGQKP